MTTSHPPGEQPPEDDTALLTTALSHYWSVYDGQISRIYQIANFYLVVTAILFTAYTSAINGKHYGLAAALAIAGLGLTALTTAVLLVNANETAQAEPGLAELHNRMAGKLGIDPIRVVTVRPGRIQMRINRAVTFGLAALLNIGGLLYALIR